LLPRSAAAAALLIAAAALAQDKELVSGPGVALVNAKCGTCHDVTHITRSKLTRAEWIDNFDNMLKRGMPPANDAERKIVIDYLSAYYGPGPAPAPSPDTLVAAATASSGIDVESPIGKLLNSSGCMACHLLDKPLVGPPFKAIAERYRGDGAAAAKLAGKVRQGGAGAWGAIPMPPNERLAAAELGQIVDWVLGLR
jgi:cytochrome c551/c552